MQSLGFKVRSHLPCVLSEVRFDVDLPEEDEVQVNSYINTILCVMYEWITLSTRYTGTTITPSPFSVNSAPVACVILTSLLLATVFIHCPHRRD